MLPRQGVPIADGSMASNAFYAFLQDVERAINDGSIDTTGLRESIAAIARALGSPDGSVGKIPPQSDGGGQIQGLDSILTFGALPNMVQLALDGDTQRPGPTFHYSTNAEGEKGWFPISDALAGSDTATLTVGLDGVVTFSLPELPNAGGGTLQKTQRDEYGRLAGTSEATTTDLAEGSNLYFTDERAQSAVVTQSITPGDTTRAPSGDAVESALAPLIAGQTAGMIGFATKADMDASLAHPAGTLALVTNDSTAANNGTYRWSGSAWVQSADRVSAFDSRITAADLKAGATGMSYPNPTAINLDLTAGLLRITASQVRVLFGRSSFLLAGQDVALPTTRQRVIANTSTGEVSFTAATTTPSTHVILGSYDHIERKLVGFPPHTVNGQLLIPSAWGRASVTTSSAITFDVLNRQLVLTGVRITTPDITGTMSETVPFPANAPALYRLEWVRGSGVSFVPSSNQPNPLNVVFAFVRVRSSGVDVYGIDEFTVTGGSDPNPIYEGTLIGVNSAEFINFDWIGGFLRITAPNQVRCLYGRNVPLVPAQNVALPDAGLLAWHKVLYDTETGLLSTLPANNAFQPGSTIVVGMFKPNTRQIHGFPAYYVNGQPSVGGGSSLDALEWLAVDGPTEPSFTVPSLLPDFKTFGASETNTDHNTVYALYDALVSTYPDYVTRSTLGLDDDGNTIYRYDFKPPADNGSGTAGRLAKMILISSTHGYERAGIYCLHSALHQVCSRWQDDDLLGTLRWNCHFIVVPCLVPYGFDTVDRLNPNGVDIARNFTAEWSAAQANSGTGPLSEKESQYMDAVMAANRDAIYCGSFHNFLDSSSGDTNFIWNASATQFGIRLAQRIVSKMSRKWKPAYPWLPQNNTTLFGYSNLSAPPGSEGKQSTLAYGIQGGSFEISRRLWDAPDPTSYSQYVNTLGTETIVNWLLMNLEHGADLYNGRGI